MGILTSIKSFFNRETKNDPAYQTDVMMYTPGQPVYTPKNYAHFVAQGYRRNGTVYNCTNKIAGGAAGIKAKLYTDRSMKREIESHPLLDLWNMPNPMQSGPEFVEKCFGFWLLSGNMYVWANRPYSHEPPEELYAVRPDRTKIVPSQTGIDSYVYGYGSARPQIFKVQDTMHLKFPAYDDDYYGLSPIEVASNLVDQQNEGNSWNTALMQNAGKPASVFMSKGFLTIEQRNQVKTELRRRYQGKSNAGMPMVLEADMSYQSMSMTPYELDWLKSRELNTRDIAAIFDVAPELVGDSAGKTFANQKEAKLALITGNILPKLDRFYGHLNVWLVPMYEDLKRMGAFFTFDIEDIEELQEMYRAAQKAKSDRATVMWNSGQCSLRVAQMLQGVEAKPKVFLDVYKIGQVLVREEDLEAYAMQSLQKPAAPPAPVPEPMLNLPAPGGTQPPQPAPTQPPTSEPKQPVPNDGKSLKGFDANGIYQPDDAPARLAAYKAQGVTHLTWKVFGLACDECMKNDGQTVEVGSPFKNGLLLPPAHPECVCEVRPSTSPVKVDLSFAEAVEKKQGRAAYRAFMEMYAR
jgi:HK97 family phage portal protein